MSRNPTSWWARSKKRLYRLDHDSSRVLFTSIGTLASLRISGRLRRIRHSSALSRHLELGLVLSISTLAIGYGLREDALRGSCSPGVFVRVAKRCAPRDSRTNNESRSTPVFFLPVIQRVRDSCERRPLTLCPLPTTFVNSTILLLPGRGSVSRARPILSILACWALDMLPCIACIGHCFRQMGATVLQARAGIGVQTSWCLWCMPISLPCLTESDDYWRSPVRRSHVDSSSIPRRAL